MLRVVWADWIKIRHNRKIMLLCAAPIFFVSLLYLVQTYLIEGSFRLTSLQAWGLAGAYALVVFATIVRKIWGIVFGFELIRLELVENRTDFFIHRTGRSKLWGSKVLLSTCLSFIMVLMSCFIPATISFFIGSTSLGAISILTLFLQCVIVWLMTLGSILVGMLAALIIKDVMVILSIVLTLEFFSGIYPQTILNIWDRIDGYIYISPLMIPLRNCLEGMDNFNFIISDLFTPHLGMLLWGIILLFYIGTGFIVFSRKDF